MKLSSKLSARTVGLALVIALLTALCSYFSLFSFMESATSDFLYQNSNRVNPDIIIIGIDDASFDDLGPYSTWTRQYAADLVHILNNANAPALIAFDVDYFGTTDEAIDSAFAQACKDFGRVICTSTFIFSEEVLQDKNGTYFLDTMYVNSLLEPYDALRAATIQGFSNTLLDPDSYVRRSLISIETEGTTIYSFAYRITELYCNYTGSTFTPPKLSSSGDFSFRYSGGTGRYQKVSLSDVLDGTVDPAVFKDKIVLVGAYASGLQDEYLVPSDKSNPMFGVEIHANIVNALLSGETSIRLSPAFSAGICAVFAFFFTLLISCSTMIFATVLFAVTAVAAPVTTVICNSCGIQTGILLLPLYVFLIYIVFLIKNYLLERKKRTYIISILKKYVAPQVVDELDRKNLELTLGGENRTIAVLFVDIRSFTTLSEQLSAPQIIFILNRYLSLVNECVFRHNGTLDKFIGDAAMAVFNSPIKSDGYLSDAALTAIDIMNGIPALNRELANELNTPLALGIGLHCGEAVVGNIGSEFRMDYTAIGDTVNIASRLESIALPGQILVSEAFAQSLDARFTVQPLGERDLKGKQNAISVYELLYNNNDVPKGTTA